MKISELAERSGVSARVLRYYEEKGFLTSERDYNGYRVYGECHVQIAQQIRELFNSGLTSDIVNDVLPCVITKGEVVLPYLTNDVLEKLRSHQAKMSSRIRSLADTHAAIENYITAVSLRTEEIRRAEGEERVAELVGAVGVA